MAASTRLSILLVTVASIFALAFAFTRYTLPNHGGPAYGDIQSLLEHALGDQPPPVPGPPAALPMQVGDSASPPIAHRMPEPPAADPAATAWLTAAIDADSAAVRAWLDPAVLAISTTSGDTVHTVLWRVALHRGCPVVSRFRATAVGRATGTPRLVALTADCPRVLP